LEVIVRKRKSTQKKTPSRYWDDSDWAIANAQMLSQQYPNQWVAIYNKKVIAHHKELGRVARQALKLDFNDPVFTFSERGIHVYGHSTSYSR
jgi:hypothetical protein